MIYGEECPYVHLRKKYPIFLKWKVLYMFKSYILLLIFYSVVNPFLKVGYWSLQLLQNYSFPPFNYFSFLLHRFWKLHCWVYFSIHLPGLYISVKFITLDRPSANLYGNNILGFWYLILIMVFMISSYTLPLITYDMSLLGHKFSFYP